MNHRRRALLLITVAISAFAGFLWIASETLALSEKDIVYPVAELGGCKSEEACKAYCEKPSNMKACVAFAEKYDLLQKGELERAKKFLAAGTGPGGCESQSSCEAYCNDVGNIKECVAFAEKHGLMPPEELEEAKKVQSALASGAKLPGGCKNKNECEAYCQAPEKPEQMEECLAFAETAGFIPPEELKDAKKVLEAMKKGVKPPPCRGKKECDVYCGEPQNFESCLAFAEAAGLISPEELEMARKTGGKGPGDCRGKEECDAFCEDENNLPACIDFAVEHGLMSAEDAEMAKKTGGKGPGDCRGKEECEAFCQDTANQEVCFNFAKEHGLVSEADLKNMEEGRQKMNEAFSQAPPEVLECLQNAIGSERIEQLKAGTGMPSREIGDVMRGCFEQAMSDEGGRPEGMPGRSRGGSSASIKLIKETGGMFTFIIRAPGGVKEFSFSRSGGTDYGGGVPGCPQEFKNNNVIFSNEDFPMEARVIDCSKDFEYKFTIPSPSESGQASGVPAGPMPSEEGAGPGGEGGFQPDQFRERPDGGGEIPGGAGAMSIDAMPPQVKECLKAAVGEETLDNLRTGQAPPPADFGEKMRSCIGQQMNQGMPPAEGEDRPNERPEGEEHDGAYEGAPGEGMIPEGEPASRMPPPSEMLEQFPPETQPEMIQQFQRQVEQETQTQMQQQIQEQMQIQMQQQIQEQMQQQLQPPPPESLSPTSLRPPGMGSFLIWLLGGILFSQY